RRLVVRIAQEVIAGQRTHALFQGGAPVQAPRANEREVCRGSPAEGDRARCQFHDRVPAHVVSLQRPARTHRPRPRRPSMMPLSPTRRSTAAGATSLTDSANTSSIESNGPLLPNVLEGPRLGEEGGGPHASKECPQDPARSPGN